MAHLLVGDTCRSFHNASFKKSTFFRRLPGIDFSLAPPQQVNQRQGIIEHLLKSITPLGLDQIIRV